MTLLTLSALLLLVMESPGQKAYERANRQFAAGQFAESLVSIEEALRLDPRLVPGLTLKAKLSLAAKDYDAARRTLSMAVEFAPAAWYPQFLLGFTSYLQNELKVAIGELERAARLGPNESKPLIYLGLAHESLGNSAKALEQYGQAIRTEESNGKLEAETLLTPARLLLLMGRLDECSKLLDRAIKLEPDSRDVHYERSRLLLKRGDAPGAARDAERALSLPMGGIMDRQIRYILVRAYGLMGENAKAARHADALREEIDERPMMPPH